jgi:curli production assembly/transport component CsgG
MRLYTYYATLFFIISGCGAYIISPQEKVLVSTPTTLLKDLPKPKEPIVVGLYKFRDQTGSIKPLKMEVILVPL